MAGVTPMMRAPTATTCDVEMPKGNCQKVKNWIGFRAARARDLCTPVEDIASSCSRVDPKG
jgi:hypothetical protein